MSDLTFIEKSKLERQFGMGSGYVLNFSNRTFAEFVADSTGRDIDDAEYDYASGSKANRLRAFWAKEPNHVVGKLINDLLDYCCADNSEAINEPLLQECRGISKRLLHGTPIEEIDAIAMDGVGRDFEILSRAVRNAIDKNEPEAGLDRLHAFVVKYIRNLCQKRGIRVDRKKPLHSLFGEYVKKLRREGLLESEMTERILKSSISTMEAFNRVRNEQSLAHDNPILNYDESLLIFSHVCSAIRFIRNLEARADKTDHTNTQIKEAEEEIPF